MVGEPTGACVHDFSKFLLFVIHGWYRIAGVQKRPFPTIEQAMCISCTYIYIYVYIYISLSLFFFYGLYDTRGCRGGEPPAPRSRVSGRDECYEHWTMDQTLTPILYPILQLLSNAHLFPGKIVCISLSLSLFETASLSYTTAQMTLVQSHILLCLHITPPIPKTGIYSTSTILEYNQEDEVGDLLPQGTCN